MLQSTELPEPSLMTVSKKCLTETGSTWPSMAPDTAFWVHPMQFCQPDIISNRQPLNLWK